MMMMVMMMITTRSISITISLKHIGLRIEKKKEERKIWMNFHLPWVACEQFLCCDRWLIEQKEGSKKGSPPIPCACFSCVYFAPAPVIFFALPFYSWNLVPAFQVQIDVFQSVLTSTCEKQEGMQNKY